MPKISAVINTRNEESNIRYCLESVKWCDEIIIVDMESEDRTVEIARQYTDKIYRHDMVLAFDAARKYAVDQATGNWILLIDADEMVPRSLSKTLVEIATQDSCDIVYMPFKTFIMGAWMRHTMWWPEYHARFFKKGAIHFTETVHAYMHESAAARILKLEPIEINAIYHFNYRDAAHFVEKLNRYTTIEATHLYDKNVPFSLRTTICESIREFKLRYISNRGYRDGLRGFALSIMMAFYRFLSHIKLWELYAKKSDAEFDYINTRSHLVNEYKNNER